MVAIGVFADTGGDLSAFDAAVRLLAQKGAHRFLFAGGRYEDLDLWVAEKREQMKAKTDYRDTDFLCDVTNFLVGREQVERPLAFGEMHEQARALEALSRLSERLLRTPERGSGAWNDDRVPKKMLEMLEETLCCLVHDRNDLNKEDLVNASVLVHGNETKPQVVQIGARVFVTPGRVQGASPSVGLLEVKSRQLTFSAFSLSGDLLLTQPLGVSTGKMKLALK